MDDEEEKVEEAAAAAQPKRRRTLGAGEAAVPDDPDIPPDPPSDAEIAGAHSMPCLSRIVTG